MNKKNVLAALALSTIALAQAGYVSADELAPIDSSAPATEVVTPTTPSASTETEAPATQPTEPSVTPVDPTTPSVQDKDNAGSLDGVSTDKPAPSDKPQDKDNAGSLDGVPTPSDKPQDKDNAGSLDGVTTDKPALQTSHRTRIMQVALMESQLKSQKQLIKRTSKVSHKLELLQLQQVK